MKKHYNTKWLSTLTKGLVMSVSLLFVGSMAMAGTPLSGTYTINSTLATAGTNFQTFNDLVDSLNANGTSAAVTVNVAKGSGPYAERVVFDAIKGVDAKSPLTINGNGATVVNTASNSVFEFNGADYITLDNIRMDAQGTGNGTRDVHFWKGASNNTVKNCEMIISKYTGTSSAGASYVAFANSTTSARSAGNHGENNVIDNNKMWNGGATGNEGPYFGISDFRSSGTAGTGNNMFTNNDIQDVYYYGVYCYYTRDNQANYNDIHDVRSNANYFYPMYMWYPSNGSGKIAANNNKIHDIECLYEYGLYIYRGTGGSNPIECNENEFYNIESNYMYGPRVYYCNNFECNDNDISNNDVNNYLYGFYNYGSTNGVTSRNTVRDNVSGFGIYGFYTYYNTGDITNNLYYNNDAGSYNYAFLGGYQNSGRLNMSHNTVVMNYDADYYIYGFYQYHYASVGTADIGYRNNIFYGVADALYGVYPVYGYQFLEDIAWEHNDFYVDNSSTNYYGTNSYTTLAGFNTYVNDNSNIEIDPKFNDLKVGDVTPTNPAIANYGVPGYETVDYFEKTRTACGPDLGGIEFFVDHNASNLVFTGTNECGGYMEEIKFDFNNGTSVDLVNARAFYTINGGTPVVEEIAQIDANSSATYTFNTIPVFHEPGTNTIEVGLLCDDNAANNTLTTTIDITPAPHSFDIWADETTFPGYYRAGSMTNPDVTVPGVQVDYDVNNPTKYGNGAYGTDWTMVISSWTENGTMVGTADGIALTNPGASKGVLSFDPVAGLADSTVFLGLTVTDLVTGCDSTFGRWIYVPHTPQVDWTAPASCDGDIVAFVNGTKQTTGAVEYTWNFDDAAAGAEDNNSTISDPVHTFTTYGTYNVEMKAWNFDYPKFVYTLTKPVSVSPVPTIGFTVKNACEGNDISFTNATTLPSGITGTIDYTWNFGDNSAKSTMENPTHRYAAPGGYEVTLTASLNGCESKLTKNANQFATPVADFTQSGTCNLEEIVFANNSTIALGNTGYKWNFNDGNVSNLSNPMHAFDMPGSHTVKLTAVSEFGCTDEIEKTFSLNESPKADFSFTDACSETAVDFTREGSLPTGANSIFEWDFAGERVSTKENDSHLFGSVGVKAVSLKVSSDNGCTDMIVKEFVVKLQAKADFVVSDVCEGDDAVFTNKSEVAAGNLNYAWRFGDADVSDLTSPRHTYDLATAGVTESFQVTLLALVPGGCSDSIAKTVTVNAKSDASFTATTQGRVVTTSPATTDPTNTYNWTFGDGGRSSEVSPTYTYTNADADMFEVCLAIINNAGCISRECSSVEVDLVGINKVAAEDIFTVYPNPNAGEFNVKVLNPAQNLNIVVMDATGKVIKTVNTDASGIYNVDITDVAAGVYMVQVVNGNFSAMQRVTVAK